METPFILEGRTKPFSDSLETIVDLNVAGINIPHYLAYVPVELNFRITSGTLDVQNSFTFTQYTDKPPSLVVSGDVVLNNLLALDLSGNELINIPRADVSLVSSDLITGEKHLSRIIIDSPEFHLLRDSEGSVNIPGLLAKRIQHGRFLTIRRHAKPAHRPLYGTDNRPASQSAARQERYASAQVFGTGRPSE